MSISTLYYETIAKKDTPEWNEACRAFGAALLQHQHIMEGLNMMGDMEDGFFKVDIAIHRDDVAYVMGWDEETSEVRDILISLTDDGTMRAIAGRMKRALEQYYTDDLSIVARLENIPSPDALCPRCHALFVEDDEGRCSSCGYDYEDPEDAADEGWMDDSEGKIGPGHKYTVKNHSQVRVLLGGKDDTGMSHSGKIGVIEGFDYNTVPMKVFVQFPDENGEFSGEKIYEFAYYDVAPVDAEEA